MFHYQPREAGDKDTIQTKRRPTEARHPKVLPKPHTRKQAPAAEKGKKASKKGKKKK